MSICLRSTPSLVTCTPHVPHVPHVNLLTINPKIPLTTSATRLDPTTAYLPLAALTLLPILTALILSLALIPTLTLTLTDHGIDYPPLPPTTLALIAYPLPGKKDLKGAVPSIIRALYEQGLLVRGAGASYVICSKGDLG